MNKDAFETREQALENEFFHAIDQKLLKRLKTDLAHARSVEELADLTGIENRELLEELLAVGIEGSKLMAFTLLPLAFVAWADGHVDEEERKAVLNTATALGYGAESASQALLGHWLVERPADSLLETWQSHARAIIERIKPVSWDKLADLITERCEIVARATGGVLGIGSQSASERDVVAKVTAALGR